MTKTVMEIYEQLSPHSNDPEKFEQTAQQILQDEFAELSAEQRSRAEQITWNINQQLRNYKDPIARMNKMIELFWHQFSKFQQCLNEQVPQLVGVLTDDQPTLKSPSKNDNVVDITQSRK